jgi:hypothetical protein
VAALKNTDGITEHLIAFTRLAGSFVYTIFKMTMWTVALGALGFAILFYIGGVTELVGGAIRVAAGSAIVYLAVTQLVKRVLLPFVASPEGRSGRPHASQ